MARGVTLSIRIREKRFGGAAEPLFADLALDVAAGEVLAVLGPSGVGKSTLLRIVAGLDTDFAGTVTIDGAPPQHTAPPGFVFQDARLLPWLTAADNVRLAQPRRPAAEADALFAELGLAGAGALYPHQLSGGMARRVALARAIFGGGGLLLLDEPFVSLDGALVADLRRHLKEIIRSRGLTALLVSHDPADAAALATRTIRLAGRPASIVAD